MLAYSDNLPWITEKAPLCRNHLATCVANLPFPYQCNRYFFRKNPEFIWWKICIWEFINDKVRRGCLGSYMCRLQSLPSLSSSPLTVVADPSSISANAHFNNSSGISMCFFCRLSVKLYICGKAKCFWWLLLYISPTTCKHRFSIKSWRERKKEEFWNKSHI